MNILNLFSGIGGNRTLWGDEHEITAVENNEEIANIYQKRFPNDLLYLTDAYQYLEEYYKNFDFIWASPPCQSHTRLLNVNISKGCTGVLPDLRMYSIIIFLNHFYKGYFVIENVKSYYTPLIKPTSEVGRHNIWSNFPIVKNNRFKSQFCKEGTKNIKTQTERNTVLPEVGKYILDSVNTITLEEYIK